MTGGMEKSDELKEFFAAQKAAARANRACCADAQIAGGSANGGNRANGAGSAGECAEAAENARALAECAQTRRFKCVVAYDGTDFCGWQSQAGGGSVQDFIEYRLRAIFKKSVRIHGSGRTDAGVHAAAQVFHFDAVWNHSPEALLRAMRSGNAQTVRILSLEEIGKDFHARFSAKGKRYVYKICKGFAMPDAARYRWSLDFPEIDVPAMRRAAQIFIGTHDFKAFSANRNDGKKENTIKTIFKLDIAETPDEIFITAEGDGFLYKMVRMLVGALVQVGRGKLQTSDLENALASKTRTNLFQAAPAQGLFLDEVFY